MENLRTCTNSRSPLNWPRSRSWNAFGSALSTSRLSISRSVTVRRPWVICSTRIVGSLGRTSRSSSRCFKNSSTLFWTPLSEREAGVISLRFGLTYGEPKTLDEIGKVYGVTRERIRQIESKTLSKLRHRSRSQVLEGYFYAGGQRPKKKETEMDGDEQDDQDVEAVGQGSRPDGN